MHVAEPVAATYGRALLELAAEKDQLEEVREEVAFLLSLIEAERDLRTFIETPRIARSAKRDALERALRGRVSDAVLNFVLTVFLKGRETFLVDALREFESLYARHVGLVRVEATTAKPLPAELSDVLRDKLAGTLQKKIELENHVDEGILGGLVLRFDGMVADGSIRSSLDAMAERMLSVKFGSELIHED